MAGLPDPPLMLITGEAAGSQDLLARVRAAVAGGIRWIQLRSAGADGLRPAACTLHHVARDLARDPRLQVSVNDRLDIALDSGCGLHLPAAGLAPAEARRLLGARLLGQSAHSLVEIEQADLSLDYVQLGPIHDTASKRAYGPPLGLDTLSAARSALRRRAGSPALVAVGGIGLSHLPGLARAGAQGIAVIGAVWESPDPERAAGEMVEQWRRALRSSS